MRTFAWGKLAGSNDKGGDDGDGWVLAKKHRGAMEEFIQKNLTDRRDEEKGSNGDGRNDDGNNNYVAVMTSEADRELYAEVLEGSEGSGGEGGVDIGGKGTASARMPRERRETWAPEGP